MAIRFARLGVVLLGPLALCTTAGAWAGCSSDDEQPQATPDAAPDALPEASLPPVKDAGIDTGADPCASDFDSDGLAKHLSCAGLYSDIKSKTIHSDNREYKPGVEFWSDGAVKRRWVNLPTAGKILIDGTSDAGLPATFDEWNYPNGTELWKEFTVDGKLTETRLFKKRDNGYWAHTTYAWREDDSDADRLGNGKKIARDGGPDYEIPDESTCDNCHTGRVEPVLGFEAVQLGLPTATGVTLAKLASEDRFSIPAPATAFTIPDDPGDGGVAPPALGWLNANCGSCHNSNENAAATFKAHFLIRPSSFTVDAGGPATANDFDALRMGCNKPTSMLVDGGFVPYLTPGDPSQSEMSILSGKRAPDGTQPGPSNQMPPVVSHRVDTTGHALLDTWISSLTACPPP